MRTPLSISSIKMYSKVLSQPIKCSKHHNRQRNKIENSKNEYSSLLSTTSRLNFKPKEDSNNHTNSLSSSIKNTTNLHKINSSSAIIIDPYVNKPKANPYISTNISQLFSPMKSRKLMSMRNQMNLNTEKPKRRKKKQIAINSLQFNANDNNKITPIKNSKAHQTMTSNQGITEDSKSTQLHSTYHSDIKTPMNVNLAQIPNFKPSEGKIKALRILSNSLILTTQEKISLSYLNKDILSHSDPHKILIHTYEYLIKNMKRLQLEVNKTQLLFNARKVIEDINNYPSKTTQIALSFITKDKEYQLIGGDDSISHYLIHLLYVLLQEAENYSSIRDGYRVLFNKYKCNSISNIILY